MVAVVIDHFESIIMKIIHFSDPHAGGPAEDMLAYLDKRWVGVFNYHFRRRFQHDLTNLSKTVDYILQEKPDVAVCTGDLTSTGQVGEFAMVREILQPLRDSAIPVLYVPGNHDCYVKRPWCVKAMKETVQWLSGGNYSFDDMPFVRHYGECEFILVNTSRPSNLLCSWGFMSRKDSAWIAEACNAPKRGPRILINHYPLREENNWYRVRHRLFGQSNVVELLNAGVIDLSLTGHVHRPIARLDERGRGECIAGSVTRNGSLSKITYDAAKDVFQQTFVSL